MKNSIFIAVFCLFLMNCKSDAIEKPDNLVDQDKMVDVIYDLYVLNAIKSTNMNYLRENNITNANYVFKNHNIDSLQFSQSDLYYASDVEEYDKMYQRVTQRLQDNKAIIDSLIAKGETVKPDAQIELKKSPTNTQITSDTLRKGPFGRKNILKQ